MEPILTILEKKQMTTGQTAQASPVEELTSLDRINKSTLIQPDLVLHGTTRVTQVIRETTDDR